MQELQSIGMSSDFFAGIMVAWQLEGVKFVFGQTIVTTAERMAGFGGYRGDREPPGGRSDGGRLIAEQGYEVKLLPYMVEDGGGFSVDARFVVQARALDDGDALMRRLGTLGTGVHLGTDHGRW